MKKRGIKKIVLLNLFFIIFLYGVFIVSSSGNTYYADVKIDINENGFVEFSGITNYNDFKQGSDLFTTKTGRYWILNITVDETFSDLVYEIKFPQNAQINYIKSTALINILSQNNYPIIKGIQSNKNLEIIVQYSIDHTTKDNLNYIYYFIIFFVILILFFIYYVFFNKKYINNKNLNLTDDLNERQKEIIKLLNGQDLSQKKLEDVMKIPKSSLSRNVDMLVKKGLIEKKQIGMTNILSLKK